MPEDSIWPTDDDVAKTKLFQPFNVADIAKLAKLGIQRVFERHYYYRELAKKWRY